MSFPVRMGRRLQIVMFGGLIFSENPSGNGDGMGEGPFPGRVVGWSESGRSVSVGHEWQMTGRWF